jgi:CRP-like cAMP-binding protein
MPVTFEAGEVVFREGDPANRFYLLKAGTVVLTSESAQHRQFPVQKVGAGEVLGWSWMFPPYYWHFTATAETRVEAVFLYGTRLREHCEMDPELGYPLMKRLAKVVIDRLQHARQKYLEAAGRATSGPPESKP